MKKARSQYKMGRHPNSLKALKEHGFKPGQSGNPKGRSKRIQYISEALRDLLEKPGNAREIAERIIKDAKAGNYNAINFLADRTEGKVVQPFAGQIKGDVIFQIGKGYADSKPDIQSDK